VREMKSQGLGATEIAKALGIGRASVYRVLEVGERYCSGIESWLPRPEP
jgi:hypothetical protein